jgi:hypothetical protein
MREHQDRQAREFALVTAPVETADSELEDQQRGLYAVRRLLR